MNYSSDTQELPFFEISCSSNQSEVKDGWILPEMENTGLISLSVFGTIGSRYSILVIEKEHLRSDYTEKDGRWFLARKENRNAHILFSLEWVVEAQGTGCLVLCGKETQAPFSSSA